MRLPDELFEQFLELTDDAIAIADDVGGILLANRAWRDLGGANDGHAVAGAILATIRRVLADDPNLTAIEAGIASVLAGAELSFAFEINAPKVASSRRGRCATVRVNERRWTVICLGRHESHASPDVAASRVAPMPQLSTRATTEHEIRNSLNAVIGFAQLLTSGISGPLNEKQAQYAELILRQGQQALEHLCSWIAASR